MSIILFFAISLQCFCLFKSFLSISAGLYSLLSHHHPENPSWVLSLALDGKREKRVERFVADVGRRKKDGSVDSRRGMPSRKKIKPMAPEENGEYS